MTSAARLTKLEQSLSPVGAVLHWLDRAQAFGSLDDYLAATFQAPDAAPLDEIIASVERGLRESMRGQPRDAVEEAVRSAARQAAFRFLLVLRLNTAASEEAREKGLMATTLFFWMRSLASDEFVQGALDEEAGGQGAAWDRWRTMVIDLLKRVYVEEAARASLERDYLDRRSSLSPDLEREWVETREQAERIARVGLFVEHAGDDDPPVSIVDVDLAAFRSGAAGEAAERAAYLDDIVRAQTWQLSGDHRRAVRVLVGRLSRSGTPGHEGAVLGRASAD